MRAECLWPEVPFDHLDQMMSRFDAYDTYIWPVTKSEIRRLDEAGRSLVYQRQHIFGISDREVLLWMHKETPELHTVRIGWTTASNEPLELDKGSIRTPRNEGFWELKRQEPEGVSVTHEIGMDAGGRIPRWLLNMVRTRGFISVMSDVRALAGKKP
jgi:hypothetical protein